VAITERGAPGVPWDDQERAASGAGDQERAALYVSFRGFGLLESEEEDQGLGEPCLFWVPTHPGLQAGHRSTQNCLHCRIPSTTLDWWLCRFEMNGSG
jgi:hypothetical protein